MARCDPGISRALRAPGDPHAAEIHFVWKECRGTFKGFGEVNALAEAKALIAILVRVIQGHSRPLPAHVKGDRRVTSTRQEAPIKLNLIAILAATVHQKNDRPATWIGLHDREANVSESLVAIREGQRLIGIFNEPTIYRRVDAVVLGK
jgi:hypothetical protein